METTKGSTDISGSPKNVSAKDSKLQGKLFMKQIETPVGTMVACSNSQGICMFEYADRESLPQELASLTKFFDAEIVTAENEHFLILEKELDEYFAGKRKNFTVPLYPVGTDFQKSVWKTLLEIPYHETWTYRKQAEFLGDAKKVRAVANANGMNKISILIPCHRVIGSNGKLTGWERR